MTLVHDAVDLSAFAAAPAASRVSRRAAGLVGSEILRIAADVRAMKARGEAVCDLTVGDFDARAFPIPSELREALHAAIDAGETNYPPAGGLPALRTAVLGLYADRLGLRYPAESVLIAAGARPLIYALFRAICDPGDRVVYPVPSWNNNHYAHLVDAVPVPVPCAAEARFLPTRETLAPHLQGARLLALCSPLNPAGTLFDAEALRGIALAVLEENQRRELMAERPLFVLYDQVYWMLRFGSALQSTPPGLEPALARYTIFVDGISKAFAATGLRVGWALGPVDVIDRMSAINGHVGAWAPRAEQVAVARTLENPAAMAAYGRDLCARLEGRLARLHAGFQSLKSAGLPADSIAPEGALYLTARLHPFGRTAPAGGVLRTNEEVRRYVLAAARLALVPFQAFGAADDSGWFRLSVGAATEREIDDALPRLRSALEALA